MSSPRHPQDPRRNTPDEAEGVPKLHAREFTVPPGWYGKAAPNAPRAPQSAERSASESRAASPSEAAPESQRRGRSAHPPKELRPAEVIPTAEPPVVLATELVSSAQYERAPRIDSLPSDRIDAGPTYLDPNPLDSLYTDSDITTPFNAEVRELQALTTQPSLRARQRQAAKRRLLLVGVLFVLLCASALFVTGLVRKSPATPPLAAVQRSPVEARVQAVAKSRGDPGELENSPAAAPASAERAQPARAGAKRRKLTPDAGVTPSKETKSKLITRTPSF